MNKLKDKVAVVYGNGAVGGAMAKAFAHEGARIFLTGLTSVKLRAIADEILAGGGSTFHSMLLAFLQKTSNTLRC